MAELLRMKEIWIGRGIVDIQYINSHKSSNGLKSTLLWWWTSLRSRRLEVAGERDNGRARGSAWKERAKERTGAPVFSCAHYFQAPATQASGGLSGICILNIPFII